MKSERTECGAKHRHASRGAADAHRRGLVARQGPRPDLEVYPCPWCHGWHVGRVPARGHRNKYRFPPEDPDA